MNPTVAYVEFCCAYAGYITSGHKPAHADGKPSQPWNRQPEVYYAGQGLMDIATND
jgi:hypothetical protein